MGQRQHRHERDLQELLVHLGVECDRRRDTHPYHAHGGGARSPDRGRGEAEGGPAPAHAGEHEPGHHDGHQRPADSHHQRAMRRAARPSRRVHQEPAAVRRTRRLSNAKQQIAHRRDRAMHSAAGAAGGGDARPREIRGLRARDAERDRDRGSQRASARRQLRSDLHGHYQTGGGGSACGAARVRGPFDRPAEPPGLPHGARSDQPAAGNRRDIGHARIRRAVPRSRPLQGRQRHARSPDRRHAAPGGRQAVERRVADG